MSNVVAIPFHHKPELLWITLDYLKKCPEFENYFILFRPDQNSTRECYDVIHKKMENFSNWRILNEEPRRGVSNVTYPVLRAMQEASKITDEYFILITEDWRVSNDFFKFYDYVFHHFFNENVFSCSGWRTECTPYKSIPYENDLVFSLNQLSGACEMMTKETFKKYIEPHMKDEYYNNIWKYVSSHFPDSPWKKWAEVDGLEGNIQWQIQKETGRECRCLRPAVSRVQHTGFWQRGICPFKGPLDERIKKIYEVINSKDLYYKYRDANDWADFHEDIKWEKLRLVRAEDYEKSNTIEVEVKSS